MPNPEGWFNCCKHCGCDEWNQIGHDDTCIQGCNDGELDIMYQDPTLNLGNLLTS